MIETVGVFRQVAFEVSTRAAPGTYSIDGRIARSLPANMSAQDFKTLISEHKLERIVFAKDISPRAREIFFVLAEGFDSLLTTDNPRSIECEEAWAA